MEIESVLGYGPQASRAAVSSFSQRWRSNRFSDTDRKLAGQRFRASAATAWWPPHLVPTVVDTRSTRSTGRQLHGGRRTWYQPSSILDRPGRRVGNCMVAAAPGATLPRKRWCPHLIATLCIVVGAGHQRHSPPQAVVPPPHRYALHRRRRRSSAPLSPASGLSSVVRPKTPRGDGNSITLFLSGGRG